MNTPNAKKRGRPTSTQAQREQRMVNVIATVNQMANIVRKEGTISVIQMSIRTKIHFKTIELSYVPYFAEMFTDVSYNKDTKTFYIVHNGHSQTQEPINNNQNFT